MPALPDDTLADTEGSTLKFTADVSAHNPFDTITEYEVADVGETIIGFVVAPVFQTYVVPPDAVSVALLPEQIAGVPVMDAVTELILTEKFPVFVQPFVPVTITE